MYISLLFWLALAMPGYVVVRYIWEDDLASGLMGTIALSYLASFGLLSGVSILCYVFQAPLWVFSAACFLSVVAAAIELTRKGWWRATGSLLAGGLCLALVLVLADMVMGGRVGAMTGGDAPVHLSRIRVLLDHGFNNYDPFVGAPYFFPIYHTNILHALYASCSQLTDTHHIRIWFASLPWAKMLIASGSYYLAWCVFERRWVAWVAVMFTIGWWGPVKYIIYPNKLAPLWLLAMMLGFTIQACRSTNGWRVPLKLFVGSLVLGQVHSLYGAFAGLAAGPLLFGVCIHRFVRGHADRWRIAACIVSLTAALPFLLISKLTVRPGVTAAKTASVSQPDKQAIAPKPLEASFKLRRGWGKPDWRTACLGIGIACAMAGVRRKQAALLLAIAATVLLIHQLPLLRSVALDVLKQKWIVGRLGIVLDLIYVALVPTSVALFVERKVPLRWIPPLLTVIGLLIGMAFPRRTANTTWDAYYQTLSAPRAARENYLDMTKVILAFCAERIPRGETILAGAQKGMVITMVHDCHIVAPERGGNGIADLGTRRRDLRVMMAPDTPWHTRRDLLRKYDITYFIPAGADTSWLRGHLKEYRSKPGFQFYAIDTEH